MSEAVAKLFSKQTKEVFLNRSLASVREELGDSHQKILMLNDSRLNVEDEKKTLIG